MRTYPVFMNITLSIDEQIAQRAREKASAMGKSLNQVVRDYLQHLAGDDELERDLAYLDRFSGLGDASGWKFNRDELHERR